MKAFREVQFVKHFSKTLQTSLIIEADTSNRIFLRKVLSRFSNPGTEASEKFISIREKANAGS